MPEDEEKEKTEEGEEVKITEEESSKEKKEAIEEIKEIEEKGTAKKEYNFDVDAWKPKTEIGQKVKSNEITSLGYILSLGKNILEVEVVDYLLPDLQADLLMIGQAKGKFGGGKRRVFKQTQKKTSEGNKPKFVTLAVVGNNDGFIGIGYGKAKETVPSREKAFRNAKLNIIRIKRGCGSWECGCKEPHTLPFKVEGKCGSTRIVLMPAPRGTGLSIEKECAKVLSFAGISDCWSKSFGHTNTKLNLIKACFNALKMLSSTKIPPKVTEDLGIVNGRIGEDND